MEIVICPGGLTEGEVVAINKIEKAFSGKNSMFPWKGYAGFRFISSKGQEGEFDLVIVTHCNVIIVELKDWNYGPITCKNGKWYNGDNDRGKSPVSVTQNKVYTLKEKFERVKNKFTNKGYSPFINFFVVITGNSDFSQLPEVEKLHTISLEEFISLSDQKIFNTRFRPHPNSQVLNKDFPVFDQIFGIENVVPKPFRVNGYSASKKDAIFKHPKLIYQEFLAKAENITMDKALLRVWYFNHIGDKAHTPDGRLEIISREREVLQHIKHQNSDLYHHCLGSSIPVQKEDLTVEFCELIELPANHYRFNEFIGKFLQYYSEQERLEIIILLIARFVDLHIIKIAHRDINDHSIWLSPSKEIALSNFISAYYQSLTTIGDYRSILSVGASEVLEPLERKLNLTPYQQDVHSLGVIVWHILTAQRISPKSCESIQDDILDSNEWYSDVILKAISTEYNNANDFLDALKESQPKLHVSPLFNDNDLEKFRKPINLTRVYPGDEFIVENDEKEVYLSNYNIVKAWLNCGGQTDSVQKNFKILNFLKKIEKLQIEKLAFIPLIHDFGIATRSSCIYLVTERIDGFQWSEAKLSEDDKFPIVEKLILAIEKLHEISLSHGDIHPKNILISNESKEIYLIDIPDLSFIENEPKNNKYSPENIDSCSSFERDNYAVMRMSAELLDISWGNHSNEYPHIAEVIQTELNDHQSGFKKLERFKKALYLEKKEYEQSYITIYLENINDSIIILPDNGSIVVKVVKNYKRENELNVTFTGVGFVFTALYDIDEEYFNHAFPPKEKGYIRDNVKDESQFEIEINIKIIQSTFNDLSQLTELLNGHELFKRAVSIHLPQEYTIIDELEIFNESDEYDIHSNLQNYDSINSQNINEEFNFLDQKIEFSTTELWKAILDTEDEARPNIEISLTPVIKDEHLILPYSDIVDPLGGFESTDIVYAYSNKGDKELKIGKVNLKKSTLNEVSIDNQYHRNVKRFNVGDIIFFRSEQDDSSLRKRKQALERLLNNKGNIQNLVNLFDPSCNRDAIQYDVSITDEHFSKYDRLGKDGNKISLNEQQRSAFTKLISNGPLSLLQGPPGTGKTEFIAAFVHYLFEIQNVRRILLVSQSHEAVNNAAERIRHHCNRLGNDLEIVRFSNREGSVSDGLKDIYSHSITTSKKELFLAELKYRVEALGSALGLDHKFISEYLNIELRLFKQIDELNVLIQIAKSEEGGNEVAKSIINLSLNIRTTLENNYGILINDINELCNAKEKISSKLFAEYNIRPDEITKIKSLAKISNDMINSLSGERVNYDEFYARSRQLIVGTCVGIGQGHIGIKDNVYDWVIIDEAARSISSELAIAMQSAKRVLLVGDHLQLKPHYSSEHKKAISSKLGISHNSLELERALSSDFERAFGSVYGQQVSASLLTQYRMAEPIGKLVSEVFYGGDLQNGRNNIPNIYNDVPEYLKSTVTWVDTSCAKENCYHIQKDGDFYNDFEANQIISMLEQIDRNNKFFDAISGLNNQESIIGVICMYSAQKRLLRQKFSQKTWREGFKDKVKIDTVDSYQGKENRIIILSITRSDSKNSPGFLKDSNRINVAMSRAMDRLIMVGNLNMWKDKNKELPLGKVVQFMNNQGNSNGYSFISVSSNKEFPND